MEGRKMAIWGMAIACGLALGGESLAAGPMGRGEGSGDQLRLRDGSCLTTTVAPQPAQTPNATSTPIRQRLQDGSCQTATCDGTPDRLRDGSGSMNGAGYGIGDVLPVIDELAF